MVNLWKMERWAWGVKLIPPENVGVALKWAEYEGAACLYCDDTRLRLWGRTPRTSRLWCPSCDGGRG